MRAGKILLRKKKPVLSGILEVNFGWGFPSEPWPLKPPCLAELGRVVGGTEVLCLDSCFVFLIYSLVPFRAGFFFLKGIFPARMFHRICIIFVFRIFFVF